MSSHRRLVNRGNRPTAAAETSASSADLPPYQPPQRPLTAKAKRDLEALSTYDYEKHHKLLKDGIKYLTNAISDTFEMLDKEKKELNRLMKKRDKDDSEKSDFEIKLEQNVTQVEAKLEEFLVKGEKAVRELIDFEVQNNQRSNILQAVSTTIANAPAPAARERAQRERNPDANSGDEEESQEDDEEQLVPVVKPIQVFKQARNEQKLRYEGKSLRDRYAKLESYINFRKEVHFAQHGEDVPFPEDTARWFTKDGPDFLVHQQENDAGDSGDDLVVQSASVITKCPLSMVDLTEPYSNSKCVHYYEKSSLLDYIRLRGTVFGGRNGHNNKEVQCVVPGCDAMISEAVCHTDPLVVRKVKKALAEARRLEDDDDSEEDEDVLPGTQRRRPAEIDEDDDHESQGRQNIRGIKAERLSRGISVTRPTQSFDEDMLGYEDQTGDLEDDDDELDEDTGFADD